MILILEEEQRWPKARNIYGKCGPHQLKAALHVHNVEVEVEELYVSDFHRARDYTLPWNASRLLRKHGVTNRLRFWAQWSFVRNLRNSIERGRAVLLVIHSILGRGSLHWISVWGYDETTNDFLCYDSQAETRTSLHGNVSYSPAQLLCSLPWYGTFAIGVTLALAAR